MNTHFGSNIDDVRAEIMRLENEPVFDQRAWAKVLAQLSNSPSRRADAVRRMMTAKWNATAIVEQAHDAVYLMLPVAVETDKDRRVRNANALLKVIAEYRVANMSEVEA